MFYLQKVCNFVVRQMAVCVVLAGLAGALWPQALVWVAPLIPWLLGLVMFGMGMTLRVEDFAVLARHPWLIGLGAAAQFTLMPLLAWLLVQAFALPPELAIGIILVGTCPGGTASNVISYLAHGDVALSVAMTMATTLLAPLLTPLLTWYLAGAWIEVSLTAMMLSIAQMVLLPVLLGLLLRHYMDAAVQKVLVYMPFVSVTMIVVLVGGVVAMSAARLTEFGLVLLAAVVLHNLGGMVSGYALARLLHLDTFQARTIGIEVGMQNSGLAASLALLYFNPAAAVPGAVFSVWHNISGSLAAEWFVRRDKKKDRQLSDAALPEKKDGSIWREEAE